MALETSFLAAENSAQERRSRSLYRFIVVSPVALLVAVGIVAHLHKPPHPSSAGDSEYDRRVLAYRERVVHTDRLLLDDSASSQVALPHEARLWVAGYASKSLQPLPPAAYEDHLRDGVRGEIVFTGFTLGARIAGRAEKSLESGHPAQAVDLALLASETFQPLGDCELIASVQSAMTQHRTLNIVSACLPQVPKSLQDAFRARLKGLTIDLRTIERMRELEARQLEDYAVRQKLPKSGSPILAEARESMRRRVVAARRGALAHNALIEKILRAG